MTQKKAKKIQKRLGLIVDGIWGRNSAKALMKFQKKAGLVADGVYGKKTELALFGGSSAKQKTIKLIREKCELLGVVKPEQIQYIIATAEHETGGTFEAISEKGGKKYLSRMYDPVLGKTQWHRDRAMKMGNTEQGDGVKYKGRGLVQLTWKVNYAKYGKILGIDLVNNPDLALDLDVAVYILVHGMKHGVFTGRNLDKYINENGTNFIDARRIINGTDKAVKIAVLAQKSVIA